MDTSRKRKLETDVAIPSSSTSSGIVPTSTLLADLSTGSDAFNPELLQVFYERLFPASTFLSWLSYSDPSSLKLREFSFTLKDDVYIRYLSFSNEAELRQALISKLPYKIDIGAVYNAAPSLHTSVSHFTPIEKEMVFDIDMTDYNDVRTCCDADKICERCWPLMTAAIKVVNHILRNDFGFRHLLWVYSGRRGVHCWVCDRRAKQLSNELRSAIVEYISVYLGKDNGKDTKKMNLTSPLHPTLAHAYTLLEPYFVQQIAAQRWLEDEASRARFLDYFDDSIRQEFLFDEALEEEGEERWKQLTSMVNRLVFGRPAKATIQQLREQATSPASFDEAAVRNALTALKTVLPRIVFGHVYPRLDTHVSKQMNHLLKAPFCVHPKTGRVCVPIDVEKVDDFDPFTVPTLMQLERELNSVTSNNSNGDTNGASAGTAANSSIDQTALKPYVAYFEKFVRKLEKEDQQHKLQNKKMAMVEELDW